MTPGADNAVRGMSTGVAAFMAWHCGALASKGAVFCGARAVDWLKVVQSHLEGGFLKAEGRRGNAGRPAFRGALIYGALRHCVVLRGANPEPPITSERQFRRCNPQHGALASGAILPAGDAIGRSPGTLVANRTDRIRVMRPRDSRAEQATPV